MKKNILVFPCGSEIGLEIYRSLSFSTHFKLFGGSSIIDHGKFVYQNYIADVPQVDELDFIKALNDIIKKHNIAYIIPAHDSVVLALARAKANNELACDVMTSPVETCETARSKKKTYELFKDILPTPRVFNAPQEVAQADLPVFLKPEVGQGSKGTYLAESKADLEFYITKDPSLLILENLPGREYTVDCFTDKDGRLLFYEGRERARIMNGVSVNSTTVKDDRITKIAKTINERLKFRGVWFFQVKENARGELVLMEIAPRVAGTMGLIRAKGVNLVLLSLFDAMGRKISILENSYTIVIDRALGNSYQSDIDYDHVYLDLDDLVIIEGKINPAVMAFVFQCRNKGVRLHLTTRHKEDLETTLKKYRLEGIFDEIVWVRGGEPKPTYIKEKRAIFIDDSFAERKAVQEACNIPTFDAHMIEALMETL